MLQLIQINILSKLIRKKSLDELPNLINILTIEMLFMGPRTALYN
jgi:lipopolysaccharide/colanic/teichoic acid biosynthesis glycosyltransferase